MMTSKGSVVLQVLIWVVVGLITVFTIGIIYSGGTPYEQSDLAKFGKPLDIPIEEPSPTPTSIPNPSPQDEEKILGLIENLQEVKDFKKRIEDIGKTKPIVAIDGYPDSENPYYLVQVFEEVRDSGNAFHTATFNWYRVDPKLWTVVRMDLSEYNKWDIVDTNEGDNLKYKEQKALDSSSTPSGSPIEIAQQPITHDGSRTGAFVQYNEWATGQKIQIYENELLLYTFPNGNQTYMTKGDIAWFEKTAKPNLVNSNSGNNSPSAGGYHPPNIQPKSIVQSKSILIPPSEVDSPKIPMLIGKGTSYTDSLGFTHFSGDNGVTGTVYTDSIGFTHYSDSTGRTATFHTDSLGFTTGGGITSHTDSLGFTHFGGGGLSGTAHIDSLGFTHYSDNLRGSTTCHTDTIGFTTCY